ncbi:uncharacterized protein LOC111313012 [Durio zibethinus]|uniref:Vacuolar iron transporter n=1 Tax=Durio zibethinus TaxID=66656 RepID=A0A6P6AX60_DURZI|nr:uncharacterized protein LOC111313012 [Durio zibethinus]
MIALILFWTYWCWALRTWWQTEYHWALETLSTSTKKDVAVKERAVTKWDVANHREDQLQQQLLQKYQSLGMDINDAEMVKNIFAKYKDILIDEKMTAPNAMLPPNRGGENPWKNGVVTFVAFVVFGTAPLLSFIILKSFADNDLVMFVGACFMSALALALLGIGRAKIAGKNYPSSVAIVMLNAAFAAFAAYSLRWMLRNVAGLDVPIK